MSSFDELSSYLDEVNLKTVSSTPTVVSNSIYDTVVVRSKSVHWLNSFQIISSIIGGINEIFSSSYSINDTEDQIRPICEHDV